MKSTIKFKFSVLFIVLISANVFTNSVAAQGDRATGRLDAIEERAEERGSERGEAAEERAEERQASYDDIPQTQDKKPCYINVAGVGKRPCGWQPPKPCYKTVVGYGRKPCHWVPPKRCYKVVAGYGRKPCDWFPPKKCKPRHVVSVDRDTHFGISHSHYRLKSSHVKRRVAVKRTVKKRKIRRKSKRKKRVARVKRRSRKARSRTRRKAVVRRTRKSRTLRLARTRVWSSSSISKDSDSHCKSDETPKPTGYPQGSRTSPHN